MSENELTDLLSKNVDAAADKIAFLAGTKDSRLSTVREINLRLRSALSASTTLESILAGHPQPKTSRGE